MSRVSFISIFSAALLAACSTLPLPPLSDPGLDLGKPPAGMRWATPQEKSNIANMVDAALSERLERDIPLGPAICLDIFELPLSDGWSMPSGPNPVSDGDGEWAQSYDNPGKNARLVISGNTANMRTYCGTRIHLIPWDARMRPNNSFKPNPLRGSA